MPDPGEETRRRLTEFAARWGGYRGSEKAEAQTFLNGHPLLAAFRDSAYADLAEHHRHLDRAVAAAYGWPASVAADPAESNERLLELNRRIAAGGRVRPVLLLA